ncbi:MAG: biotin--[acetyl-CoA-carboxylase] ligase [Burkholderiaceae bacterium]
MDAPLRPPFALHAQDYRLPDACAVSVVAATGSTNTDLLDQARAGQLADGQAGRVNVLVAHAQSAGRGRLGRAWLAEPGASLLMSVGCVRQASAADLAGITVALGARAAQVLRKHGVQAQVKWPNDVLLEGAKLAGILVETVTTHTGLAIVAGIGVNGAVPQAVRAATGQPTAALMDALPLTNGQAAQIGHDLAVAFADLLTAPALAQSIRTDLASAFALLDACKDRPVQVQMDGKLHAHGIARGVNAHGALLIETPQGVRAFASGEVSVRWQ